MNKQDCTCKSRNGDISDCGCYSICPDAVCQKTIAFGSGGNPSKYYLDVH